MKTGIVKRLVAAFVLCTMALITVASVAIIKAGQPMHYDATFWLIFSAIVVWAGAIFVVSLFDILLNKIWYTHYFYLALWSLILFLTVPVGLIVSNNLNTWFYGTILLTLFVCLVLLIIAICVLDLKLPAENKKSRGREFVLDGALTIFLTAAVFFSGFLIPVNNEVKTNIVDVTMNPYPVAALNDRKKDTGYGLFFSTNSFGKTLDLILTEGPANITTMHITSASLGELSVPARNVLLVADNGTRRSLTLNNVSEQDIEINVGETSRVTLIFSAAVIPGNLQIDEIVLYEKKPVLE